jgi:osmoprotectant transport system permease protein
VATRDPTIDAAAGLATEKARVGGEGARGWAPRALRYLGVPVALGLVLVALLLYIDGQSLDSVERRQLALSTVLDALWEHIKLTAVSTFFVVLLGIALGVLLTRPFTRRLTPVVLGVVNIGQAIPSIGLLAILAIYWKTGFNQAIIALVAYSVLPVLRNTMVGLRGVDARLLEAGQGMGMSKLQVLRRIELPLAVPVILAGVRTALIINVGTATLATYTGAGGLGALIDVGLKLSRDPVILVGGVLTAVLALSLDWLAGIAEDVLRPKGL